VVVRQRQRDAPRGPRLVGCLALLALVSAPGAAAAHQAGLSQGTYRVDGRVVGVDLVFARGEAAQLVAHADADRDGALSEVELLQIEGALSAALLAGVVITAGRDACTGEARQVGFVEEDGLSFAAAFTCPAGQPLAAVTVRLPLLERLGGGHRHLGQVRFTGASAAPPGQPVDFVAHRRRGALTIRRPTPPSPAAPSREVPVAVHVEAPAEPAPASPRWRVWAGMAGLFGLAGLVALRLRARRRRGA
jgi:hypothetical protein